MRASQLPFLIGVALGSRMDGLGLGHVLFSGPAVDLGAALRDAAGPLTGARPAAGEGLGRAPELSAPGASSAPGTSAAGRALAAAAQTRELPAAPVLAAEAGGAGAGSISGEVFGLQGQPLEGVLLELRPPSGSPRYRPPTATSDAAGAFEFAGLPEGRWSLSGRHERWVVQRRSNVPELLPTGAKVELIGYAGEPVEVRISGSGVERARLQIDGPGGAPEWVAWSPGLPRIVLAPGEYQLRACVDPLEDWATDGGWFLAPFASERVELGVGGGGASSVELVLAPRDSLFGVFELPEGLQADRQRATVRLAEFESGTSEDFEIEGGLEDDDRVDELGRYAFADLGRQDWTLGLQVARGSVQSVRSVRVVGPTRLDLALDSAEMGQFVTASVRTPGGAPLMRGVEFIVLYRDADEDARPSSQRTLALLQRDGTYRVTLIPFENRERADELARNPRERSLLVQADGYADAEVALPPGIPRVDVQLEQDVRLMVNLTGDGAARFERESDVRGQRLSEGTGRGYLRGRYREDEEALVAEGLTPGRWSIWVESEYSFGEEYRDEILYRGELDLVPGDNFLDVPLPERFDLTVYCPEAKAGTYISLQGPLAPMPLADGGRSEYGGYVYTEVGEDQRARFLGVLAGEYRLELGPALQRVTVPAGEIQFEGRIPSAFSIELDEDATALRRAGLRSGDVFKSMDGEPLGAEAFFARLRGLSTSTTGSAALVVVRNGASVTVQLNSADLGEGEEFDDVDLEPVIE